MILVQILKVLPAASEFEIYDVDKLVLKGKIALSDKSIICDDIKDDMHFQNIYQSFHVESIDKIENIWEIKIR